MEQAGELRLLSCTSGPDLVSQKDFVPCWCASLTGAAWRLLPCAALPAADIHIHCRHPHSQFCSVSSIPLPFHCFIRVVASPGIGGDKKGVIWSGFFLLYQQFWHLGASVPIVNLDSSFSGLPEGLIASKSCFMRRVGSFVFFYSWNITINVTQKMAALRLIQCQEHELNFYLRSKSENN